MTSANQVIWKFIIPKYGTIAIEMPYGSRIIAVQNQANDLVLWAECDPRKEQVKEVRKFKMVVTGEEIGLVVKDRFYLGTAQFEQGRYVVHVYEER